MPPADDLALPERLHPDLVRQLSLIGEFIEHMDRSLRDILGPAALRSRLPDELSRLVLVQYGQGITQRMSFYQRKLAHIAGPSAVRDEIRRLAEGGILLLVDDPGDRRATLVKATAFLVNQYTEHARRLITLAESIFVSGTSRRGNG
jgi:hypothetical protein